jgi:hypothetical protein
MTKAAARRRNLPLIEVLGDALDQDDDTLPCQACSL